MAGLLSAAELAACRAVQASSFDLTATQQRATDDGWGTIAGPTTIATFACRLGTPTGPMLTTLAAQLGNVPSWALTCGVDVDLRVGDIVVIGADTLRVHAVLEPASYNTATRAIVAEVR
jgi:hypothetical protein